jgi:MtN3 and saliva related transmembrane protein
MVALHRPHYAKPFYTEKHYMSLIDLVGYCAATLTTSAFVPQAIHTFRTKDVRGISLGMYSAFTAGVALWLVYGVLLSAWPIVVANAITLSLAISILVMKLRYHEDDPGA